MSTSESSNGPNNQSRNYPKSEVWEQLRRNLGDPEKPTIGIPKDRRSYRKAGIIGLTTLALVSGFYLAKTKGCNVLDYLKFGNNNQQEDTIDSEDAPLQKELPSNVFISKGDSIQTIDDRLDDGNTGTGPDPNLINEAENLESYTLLKELYGEHKNDISNGNYKCFNLKSLNEIGLGSGTLKDFVYKIMKEECVNADEETKQRAFETIVTMLYIADKEHRRLFQEGLDLINFEGGYEGWKERLDQYNASEGGLEKYFLKEPKIIESLAEVPITNTADPYINSKFVTDCGSDPQDEELEGRINGNVIPAGSKNDGKGKNYEDVHAQSSQSEKLGKDDDSNKPPRISEEELRKNYEFIIFVRDLFQQDLVEEDYTMCLNGEYKSDIKASTISPTDYVAGMLKPEYQKNVAVITEVLNFFHVYNDCERQLFTDSSDWYYNPKGYMEWEGAVIKGSNVDQISDQFVKGKKFIELFKSVPVPTRIEGYFNTEFLYECNPHSEEPDNMNKTGEEAVQDMYGPPAPEMTIRDQNNQIPEGQKGIVEKEKMPAVEPQNDKPIPMSETGRGWYIFDIDSQINQNTR